MKEIMRVRPGWSGAGRRCEVLCSPVYVGYIGKPAQGQHWTMVHFYDEEDPTCVKSACLEPFTAHEHKRCPLCDSESGLRDCDYEDQHTGYYIECVYCGWKTKLYGSPSEAWAAWDKRKEDE